MIKISKTIANVFGYFLWHILIVAYKNNKKSKSSSLTNLIVEFHNKKLCEYLLNFTLKKEGPTSLKDNISNQSKKND